MNTDPGIRRRVTLDEACREALAMGACVLFDPRDGGSLVFVVGYEAEESEAS